ncbi:MAG: hypothetical protein HZA95_02605 [Candidatus Vogelbacteria bacterium]|nr:hypothetical protein [Candidatus Vogelbacteria bacterium]
MKLKRVKEILFNHRLAILFAVILAFIVAFPQVYFRIDHQSDGVYQGIELLPDSPWSARVREVQDGHPNFGAIYYKDGKDNPYLFQPLGSMVVGYVGELFSLDINNTILLSRIILSFIVFILIYVFVFLLSKSRLTALCSSTVLLFAESILSFSGLSRLFHGLNPDSFLRIARPVNPAMIYVLLFSFLICFWFFYKKNDWRWGVASAILLGLNFYNYFYSWTFLYSFGAILILFFLCQKRWREALRLAGVFLGALLVAFPYCVNLYRATMHPAYVEVGARNGIVLTHAPLFVGLTAIIALIVFFLGFPKEDREKYFFSLALLLTPFITLNQQLLTGRVLQEAHYHWFFHKPIAVIVVLIVILHLLASRGFVLTRKVIAGIILTVSIFTGVFVQAETYFNDSRDGGMIAVERQKYGPVMKWLNENALKESVVLANDEISHLTVIYTPLNVFYHRAAMYSLASTKARLLDVLFTFYRLRGIKAGDAREVFFAERGNISANIYGIHYRELLGSYDAIPDDKIEEAVNLYIKSQSEDSQNWFKRVFKKYEVGYVVWDKKSDPSWQLDAYQNLVKAAELPNDMLIYRVQ